LWFAAGGCQFLNGPAPLNVVQAMEMPKRFGFFD
jgi:hypothetical protein